MGWFKSGLENFYTGLTCIAAEDCEALKMVFTPADELSDEQISAIAAADGVGKEVSSQQIAKGNALIESGKKAAGGFVPSKLELGLYGLAALAVVVFIAKKA